VIVTWHAPADANYDFKRFYDAAKQRGFLIYPGKLTQLETSVSAASARSAATSCSRR